MLLAQTAAEHFFAFFFYIVLPVLAFRNLKKLAGSNPEITNAAKKAATSKAIGLLGRLLK